MSTTPEPAPSPRRRRRWPWVLLGLALFVTLVFLGAWSWLQTEAGGEFLKVRVLAVANGALQGKLEAASLSLDGSRVLLKDVKLYTPEGELVAQVALVDAEVAVSALARGTVRVKRALVQRPQVWLVQGPLGLNLTRAVAAKVPGAADASASRFTVALDEVALEGGAVSYQDGEQRYALEALALESKATLSSPPFLVDGRLRLTGEATAPMQAPLTLTATATQGVVHLDLALGGSLVKGDLGLEALEAKGLAIRLEPELVKAFAPQVPLKVAVTLEGSASPRAVDVVLRAGEGRLAVQGEVTPEGTIPKVSVHLQKVDLSELFEGGRPSSLEGALEGALTDLSVENLTGRVGGQVAWRARDGGVLASAELEVKAERGQLRASPVKLMAPGLTATLRGTGSPKGLGLSGRVVAEDLKATGRALGELLGQPPVPMAGQGVLSLTVQGPLLHPQVTAKGTFVELGVPSVRAYGLDVDVKLPDVTKPLETNATLAAGRVVVAAGSLDSVRAKIGTQGRRLAASVEAQGALGFLLELEGELAKNAAALALGQLRLVMPDGTWSLESPTKVSWADGIEVAPLTLVNQGQTLRARFSLLGDALDGEVRLEKLLLEKLPAFAVPRSLGLAGEVTLEAKVGGTTKKPRGEVKGTWSSGRVQNLEGLGATVEAKSDGQTLEATVHASAPFAKATATAQAPLVALSATSQAPVTLSLAVDALELVGLGQALGRDLGVEGKVSARVDAKGPLSALVPTATVESNAVTWKRLAPPAEVALTDVALTVEADDAGRLSAGVGLAVLGGRVTAKVSSGKTLEQLLAADLAKTWRALELEVSAKVQSLDLARLETAGLGPKLSGTAGLEVTARGSIDKPRLSGTVTLSKVGGLGNAPIDARLDLGATRDDTSVKAVASRGDKKLVIVDGRISAPPEALLEPEAVASAPLVLDVNVGPMLLAEVLPPPATANEPPPQGTVLGRLQLSGTLGAPKASLRASIDSLAVAKIALGQAALSWDYQGKAHDVLLQLTSAGGGRLKAKAQAVLETSFTTLRRGLEWKQAPFGGSLTSDKLDLAFLSGVHPMVRTLGGQLTATGSAKGTLGTPDLQGSLTWENGRILTGGFGDYRNVKMVLDASPTAFHLKTLDGKAAGGTFSFKGHAEKSGDERWALSLEGMGRQVPVVTDDQLLAIASVRTQVSGTYEPTLVELKVDVPDATVELPEVTRKDLQDLSPHPDVVLVRRGQPLYAKAPKRTGDAAPRVQVIRVLIDAPRNLWVKSSDLNVEVGLSDGFKVEIGEQVLIYGTVSVERGRVDVIGRRFDVEDTSRVAFQGPPKSPVLNVTAVHVNDREGVTVTVALNGKGTSTPLKVSSQPPLPESEIFTLLATGRRTLKRGGGTSVTPEQAASVVGGFAANQLKKVIAQKLPLDVISIDTGSEGLQRARVEAGTYLTRDLYLGYTLQVGADPKKGENTHAGKLEYQIGRNWSFEAFAGDARAAGADLVWTREY